MMSPHFQTIYSTIATTLAGRERGGEDASARITPRITNSERDTDNWIPHCRYQRALDERCDGCFDSAAPILAELVGVFAAVAMLYPPLASMDCWLTWLGRGLVKLESESPWEPRA